MDFDVIVLGGGGAGYTSAFELSRAGKNVLLADPKGVLGGNCLYEGCVPSKTYWYASSKVRLPSFMKGKVEVDFPSLAKWKDDVQERRFKQHAKEVEEHKVILIPDRALETSQGKVKFDSGREYTGKYIVIATGAEPQKPKGFEAGITTHELLMPGTSIRSLPHSLGIVGGGYIGVEMAGIFAKLGSRVTLYASHLLSQVPQEVQSLLERRLRDLGVEIVKDRAKGVTLKSGNTVNSGKIVLTEKGERVHDEVLVATGRRPVYPSLPDSVKIGQKGEVKTTFGMRTSDRSYFAPGDVNGRHMLFHVAVMEGWVTAQNIIAGGREVVQVDYSAIPYAVYSDPQVAWTGLWRDEAVRQGIDVEVRRYDLSLDSRVQIEDIQVHDEGWIDLVVHGGSGRIVGAQVVGRDADFIIGELSLAVHSGLTVKDLSDMSQPHPTQLEAVLSLARRDFTDLIK